MKTVIAPLLDAQLVGYPYVSFLSEEVQSDIALIQKRLVQALPGRLWIPAPNSLHITFLHLMSPDVEYMESEDKLYERVGPNAHEVMLQVSKKFGPIQINSGTVEVSPAAIIVKWDDRGQMDRVREAFSVAFTVPEPTKRPPNIVHSTIARFLEPVAVEPVQEVARGLRVGSVPAISEIDLVRETRIYLQEFEVVERYPLGGGR